ncbi:MAG: dihydroorotate dehydrogenase electron transfer subunit [Firmicutes bacterium]|nr:dihydroorotate dehydrogenase electron transfer subunit [Bacillota bacterium]
MFQVKALITENRVLGPEYYGLSFLAPDIAREAKPGQFIQMEVAAPESVDPILPRPISIYRIREKEGTIQVIFKTVGRGTRLLAAKKIGELIGIRGPLGNGFSIPDEVKNPALIAGGIGMPPLFCLAEELKKSRANARPGLQKISLFYGGRTKRDLLELDAWTGLGAEIFPATEDGSYGARGFITEVFQDARTQKAFDYIVACGPQPMLQAVQKIAQMFQIPGQISMESYMACGVGACLGCVHETKSGYKRVCLEGPVFGIDEVADYS